MKRYALFCYDCYYPSGGWGDFHDTYDTAQEAQGNFQNVDYNEVVDLQTGERVDLPSPGRKRG